MLIRFVISLRFSFRSMLTRGGRRPRDDLLRRRGAYFVGRNNVGPDPRGAAVTDLDIVPALGSGERLFDRGAGPGLVPVESSPRPDATHVRAAPLAGRRTFADVLPVLQGLAFWG